MIYTILLVVHILSGSIALIGGATAIISRKGNKIHRTGGRFFTYTMASTAMSAIAMSTMKPNPFLLAIGIFTLYMTFSGWIWVMRIPQKRKVKLNYTIGVFGLLSGIFLVQRALFDMNKLPLVMLVFGGIQLIMAITDLIKKPKPGQNIIRHISKIGGAYIAAVTAFLVVNIHFLPAYLVWLGPTVIGSILISREVRKRVPKAV